MRICAADSRRSGPEIAAGLGVAAAAPGVAAASADSGELLLPPG